MAKKNFFNTPWDQRGPVEKGAILIGGGLLLLKGWSFVNNEIAKAKASKHSGAVKGELEAYSAAGQNQTYPDSMYQNFADSLEYAMGGGFMWGIGTDEDTIGDVFNKMNNTTDVLKLIQAFGTREGMGLGGWLRSEMSDSYMSYYVNDPLRRKGINYQF